MKSMSELNRIFKELCGDWRIDMITGRTRPIVLVNKRREIAKELHSRGYSTTEIGWVMLRDHSSICYLLNGRKNANTKNQTSA